MRPVEFGESLVVGTRVTLVPDDKPNRLFIVIKSWIDETLGASLTVNPGVPCYQVEDEEGRMHLLIHLPIEEDGDNNRWSLWRPDHAGFDFVSCPINSIAFAVDQLAVFQGASDEHI